MLLRHTTMLLHKVLHKVLHKAMEVSINNNLLLLGR